MKNHFLALALACVFIGIPSFAAALSDVSPEQSVAWTKRMQLIQQLQQQIAALREQLAELEDSEGAPRVTPPYLYNEERQHTNAPRKLEQFPSAGTTWRGRFPVGTPPLDAFKAFYFNTTAPTKIIASEQIKSIDINYAWSDGPSFTIDSQDFGAYWIGDFVLSNDENMVLAVTDGWSEARVILDGRLIYPPSTSEGLVRINVPKGRHTLEVEFVNNWHTVEFSASLRLLSSIPKNVTATDIARIPHSEIWYAGVYESESSDNTITLTARPSATPKILFLSSYSPVKWDASSLGNSGIEAIIYNSFERVAEVNNVPSGIDVYTADIPYGYTLMAECDTKDRYGFMACEGLNEFSDVYEAVTKLSTKPLTGFAGDYGVKTLALPGTVLTPAKIKEALAHPGKLRAEAANYLDSQDISNIF